jgi:hypothetical protein
MLFWSFYLSNKSKNYNFVFESLNLPNLLIFQNFKLSFFSWFYFILIQTLVVLGFGHTFEII